MAKFTPRGPLAPAKKMAMSAPSDKRQKPLPAAPMLKKGGKVMKKKGGKR